MAEQAKKPVGIMETVLRDTSVSDCYKNAY